MYARTQVATDTEATRHDTFGCFGACQWRPDHCIFGPSTLSWQAPRYPNTPGGHAWRYFYYYYVLLRTYYGCCCCCCYMNDYFHHHYYYPYY